MRGKDAFGGCHPFVNLAYFAFVIFFLMFFMHPIVLGISLFGAVCYHVKLNGCGSARFFLKFALPVTVLTAVINSLFNHRGETVLMWLHNGNPITLESVLYGLAAAVMMVGVLTWFGCCTAVMTADKLVYLFGRVIPSLSLVLSMTLRFVPRFADRFERVREARLCMGRPRSARGRLKNALECFSVMTMWSLEGSIETADSMISRGYGLRGRTSYSLYVMTERDVCILTWLGLCAVFLISGAASGHFEWHYFPEVGGSLTGAPLDVALYAAYFAVCATPAVIDILEDLKWRSSRSGL
ncbi:MAG: energy-coupling factor transporter transmembrane protein EcfT [Oscillospiraceae bacterium]|nr:energy-coupling factor transporter transmembrane protein EcfT [Oscillospiraceae bacterium]